MVMLGLRGEPVAQTRPYGKVQTALTPIEALERTVGRILVRRKKPWDLCLVMGCRHPTTSGKKEREIEKRLCRYHDPKGKMLVNLQKHLDKFCRHNPRKSKHIFVNCKKGRRVVREVCSAGEVISTDWSTVEHSEAKWKRPRCGAWKKKFKSTNVAEAPQLLSRCVCCGDSKPMGVEALCDACL